MSGLRALVWVGGLQSGNHCVYLEEEGVQKKVQNHPGNCKIVNIALLCPQKTHLSKSTLILDIFFEKVHPDQFSLFDNLRLVQKLFQN